MVDDIVPKLMPSKAINDVIEHVHEVDGKRTKPFPKVFVYVNFKTSWGLLGPCGLLGPLRTPRGRVRSLGTSCSLCPQSLRFPKGFAYVGCGTPKAS